MKKRSFLCRCICALVACAVGVGAASGCEAPAQGKRIVTYFASWSAHSGIDFSTFDASLATHINYAFANLSADGSVTVGDSYCDLEYVNPEFPSEPGLFGQMRALKEKAPHLKVLISVGGWSWSGNFSDVAADADKRRRFAESCAEFVLEHGFDGVDIDWEYPVSGRSDITQRPEDKQNFTLLLSELHSELSKLGKRTGKDYLITLAVGADAAHARNIDWLHVMDYIDYINLMTYDFAGEWDPVTGHNSPLYGSSSIDASVKAYEAAGVQRCDMNVGLALYGRVWTSVGSGANNGLGSRGVGVGYVEYSHIDERFPNAELLRDDAAGAVWLYDGSAFVTFDNEESIEEKCRYIADNGLGGAMMWEYSCDPDNILQRVVAKVLL